MQSGCSCGGLEALAVQRFEQRRMRGGKLLATGASRLELTGDGVPLELLDALRVRERADVRGRRGQLVTDGRGDRQVVVVERRFELVECLRRARREQRDELRIEIGLFAATELT